MVLGDPPGNRFCHRDHAVFGSTFMYAAANTSSKVAHGMVFRSGKTVRQDGRNRRREKPAKAMDVDLDMTGVYAQSSESEDRMTASIDAVAGQMRREYRRRAEDRVRRWPRESMLRASAGSLFQLFLLFQSAMVAAGREAGQRVPAIRRAGRCDGAAAPVAVGCCRTVKYSAPSRLGARRQFDHRLDDVGVAALAGVGRFQPPACRYPRLGFQQGVGGADRLQRAIVGRSPWTFTTASWLRSDRRSEALHRCGRSRRDDRVWSRTA